jgi:uncharacterized protein (TIGR03083 family)
VDYGTHIRLDGDAMSAAAARAAPDLAVPSCPEWDMAALVAHTGAVHRWVAGMLASRAAERAEFPEAPADWDDRRAWFGEGLGTLLAAIDEVGAEEPVWNWADRAPAPARFWPRRMAHETAVHRWDAQHAVDPERAEPIDDALADDGIDEYLGFVGMWLAHRPAARLHGRLGLGGRTLVLHPGRVEVADGLDRPDAVVSGSASDLLLFLTGRRPDGLGVEGDRSVLAAWEESVRFG